MQLQPVPDKLLMNMSGMERGWHRFSHDVALTMSFDLENSRINSKAYITYGHSFAYGTSNLSRE